MKPQSERYIPMRLRLYIRLPTGRRKALMADFKPGLEGVVAAETEIAEPDKEGGSLRYRGVDIEELAGHVSYGHVWGLLVDDSFTPGLPQSEPLTLPRRTGDVRVDVQSAVARRPVGPRRRPARGPAEPGGRGEHRCRGLPGALARRARPAAREGGGRVLD